MRIMTAGLLTETNSFSPLPTGLRAFHIGDDANSLVRAVAVRAAAERWTHVHGTYAEAHPGAVTPAAVYERLRDRILGEVTQALPLDNLLLDMHGGMVADGYDDPEGDLIARARSLCGKSTIIGARLDPHAHLSPVMAGEADLLCFYKENPHTDIAARGRDLIRLAVAAAAGKVKPTISTFDCRMVDVFQTSREPMRSFVAEMRALEGRGNILDISVCHGFRRADVPLMGTHVVVITDDAPEQGAELAARLGKRVYEMRGRAAQPYVALDEAVAIVGTRTGPTILADLADNPGGGSPGDSTYVLRALLDAGVGRIAVGYLVDPLALSFAREAGVGARLTMRVGGKACRLSGAPIDLEVEVRGLLEEARMTAVGEKVGAAAWVRSGEVDIVLIGERVQTYTPELFEAFGIDLGTKTAIVVKSAQHYRAHFGSLTEGDIVVDAPGVCTADWRNYPFKRVRRDIWPFVDDPWQDASEPRKEAP